MAESKRRLKKVKGVVLVMVVTIMFVLMIMLLATLAVVSSTTKRTYTKYEENQAYYTSRSVLEVFIKQYLEDKDKPAKSDDLVATEIVDLMKNHFDNISTNDLKKKTTDDAGNVTYGDYQDFTGAPFTNGFYFQQQIFGNLTPKYEWNSSEGTPEGTMDFTEDKYWTLRADAETNTAKPYSAVFEVELPDLTGMGDNAAGLFANKDASGTQKAQIKVELLRVMFLSDDATSWTDYQDGNKMDFQKVNWKKTYYRMKVTATSEMGEGESDSEIIVSVLLEPAKEVSIPDPDGPPLSIYTTSSTSADNKIKIIGGSGLTNTGNTTEFNNGETALIGNIVYDSNFRITAMHSDQWMHGEGESMVIHGGWLSMANASFKITGAGSLTDASTANRPFIYARGIKFYKVTAGSNSAAIDILCGDPMNSGTDRKFTDEAGLSWANVPDDAKDKITFVTNESNNRFYGDIYVDGDMYLGGNGDEFFGNIYCTGTIYVANDNTGQGPKFHKDVYCADVKCNANTASNKAAFLQAGANYGAASSFSLKWPDESSYISEDDPDHANQVLFNVPKRGDVYCNTTKQSKNVYSYKALGITPTPGNGKTETDVVTASDYFKYIVGSDKASLSVSASATKLTAAKCYIGNLKDQYGEYNNVKIVNTSGATGKTGLIECKMSLADFGSDTYFINAALPLQIELTADGFHNMTAHCPTFIVVGDSSVMFTVADNTNFQAGSMAVYNSQVYQMVLNNTKMYVGPYPALPFLPEAPGIQYFIGDDTNFEFTNPGNLCLTGYIYGGYADLKLDSQTNGDNLHRADLNYNGVDVGLTDHCAVFGSATFRTVSLQQIETFVYISPYNKDKHGSGGTGGRIIWSRQKYLNRG